MAEELEEPYSIDDESKWAVNTNATFAWETVGKPAAKPSGGKFGARGGPNKADKKEDKKSKRGKGKKSGAILPTTTADTVLESQDKEKKDEKPFELKDLSLKIPRGAFVAIVGRVGSGKSSLLQGLVGEMKRVTGDVGSIQSGYAKRCLVSHSR